ncbi:MAG: 23S rRNA (guanosine(2251)-2'-O)-methyltransferase RlmB [Bacillota bacterium]|nr:23S rRNA (guanosine(2251)-2'-O)-methyltransferase RlmB [Bacillota bacterium]
MNIITSNQNSIIKEIKSLEKRKYRQELGLFIAEGVRFVEEALKENANIKEIIVSETLFKNDMGKDILTLINSKGINYYTVSEKIFNEISGTQTPQGIMAVVEIKEFTLEDIISGANRIIILESLQDPGNMGTIIRTADASGMTGIILSKGCVDIYNQKVLRSTMGSIFHLPIHQTEDLNKTLEALRSKGIRTYAAHLNGTINYYDMNEYDNIAIIIGNEGNGISNETADSADILVKIPMHGKAESLNASVAAGILMYEIVRKVRE